MLKSLPRPLCCAVFKYAGYVFKRAPRGRQQALKAKSAECIGREFSGSARRQDAEIPGVFRPAAHIPGLAAFGRGGNAGRILKDGSAANPTNSLLCDALYSDFIV